MNSLFLINIYDFCNAWVFDDAERGLVAEPFVCGSTEILDEIIQKPKVDKWETYKVLFSSSPFPSYTHSIIRIGSEVHGGYYYQLEGSDIEPGWLCPATCLFFGEHPETIYLKVSPNKKPLSKLGGYIPVEAL